MRYLITGGAGFIGSHLAESLLAAEHEVLILDDYSTGRHENLAGLESSHRLRIHYGTITDRDVVRECVAQVDQVFHLASAVGVQLIMDRTIDTIHTIVEGSAIVLAECARYRRPVLLTSTSEVYGKSQQTPFHEDSDSVIGPPGLRRWSYAAAKSLDEFMALAYWHQMRLPVIIARLFNTVGPRQTGQYGMVIPRFVTQALRGEPISIYGDGKQTRCFCHVKDVVRALTGLMSHPECRGQVFNIGNDREISINGLAEMIRTRAHSSSGIRHIPYSEAYGPGFEDMLRRVPDLSKIRLAIGYTPEWSLEALLDDIIAHVRDELAAD
ncbi:MAG: GDP-mannose 4,6-dehydratase [Planctomycetes bacterium]|nr:GDP-mannose 4,6-dehydratase [Planctomycetota bacterium]